MRDTMYIDGQKVKYRERCGQRERRVNKKAAAAALSNAAALKTMQKNNVFTLGFKFQEKKKNSGLRYGPFASSCFI
jgi:hypothetical protein